MDYLTPAQAPRPPQLPAPLQRAFDQQIARMSGTALAYQIVIDEISAVNSYAMWRAFNALVSVAMLKNMAVAQGFLTPEVDQMLATTTEGYLRDIDATCRAADAHLLRLADDLASGRATKETVVEKLKRLLG